jgi:MaoC like domain
VRYFEDFRPGDVIELGSRTISKERILAFAREFDPQPFHTDEEAAKRSIYGGLLASGWHTGSLLMRILYDGLLKDSASLGSPGIDDRLGGITKSGNSHARRVLIEAAKAYRHRAKVSEQIQARQQQLPKAICDIAWRAQARLCGRYRRLLARGKHPNTVAAAIARELAAFMWAIARSHPVTP